MIQDKITQLWVKLTGRRIDAFEDSWLTGPIGNESKIDDEYLTDLVKDGNISIHRNVKNSGLIDDLSALGLSPEELSCIHPKVIDLYQNTSEYHFEIWSEWKSVFKPFGSLLGHVFSKRLQQLNIPTSALATAKGLHSEIIKLKSNDRVVCTVWYRKIKSSNDVIYSGIYTTSFVPVFQKKLLKVVFPLPNGNASVIMTTKICKGGALLLSSDGKKFGDNGFYFYLTDRKGNHWAKFVKALHEWIKVYVDEDGILRTDHSFRFYGINFLNLHYKMTKK